MSGEPNFDYESILANLNLTGFTGSTDAVDRSAPLTYEDLRAAVEREWNKPPSICGVTRPHIVHPTALGWQPCGDCGTAVYVVDTPDGKMIDLSPPTEPKESHD